MAAVVAQTDLVLDTGIFNYLSTVTTNLNQFTYSNVSGNHLVDMFSFPLEFFNYSTIFGVGTVPVSGVVSGVNILDSTGTTTQATITGLNFAASGNLDYAISGRFLYPVMFGGNDTFNGNSKVVTFYGDFGKITSTGTRTGGNDVFIDGAGAASGKLVGDAMELGTNAVSGGVLTGGRDTFTALSNDSRIIGDVETVRFGTLKGGNDQFNGDAVTGNATIIGDADNIALTAGTVIGGDDTISFTNTNQDSVTHILVGDVNNNAGGRVIGGDDTINSSFNSSVLSSVYGDVNFNGGIVIGGNDRLTGNGTQGVIGDTRTNDNTTIGGDDVFTGTVVVDFLVGDVQFNNASGLVTGGNDIFHGGNMGDTLIGDVDVNAGILVSGGDDTLYGEDGDDTLYGDVRTMTSTGSVMAGGNDKLYGGAGNDFLLGGGGDDLLDGGAGEDTASYLDATSGITVSLLLTGAQATGGSGTDTLVGIESLIGSKFGDDLTGNSFRNIISGNDGDDTLSGEYGNDDIYGENGNDTINGGADNDNLYGGCQNDLINGDAGNDHIQGGDGNDTMDGGTGNDTIFGGAGNDMFIGGQGADDMRGGTGIDTVDYTSVAIGTVAINLDTGTASGYGALGDKFVDIEKFIGTNRNDYFAGDHGDNQFDGGNGNDTLQGRWGNDTLNGGAGQDSLFGGTNDDILNGGDNIDGMQGGDGNDIMNGDAGNDTLLGGAGVDTLNGGTGNDLLNGGTGIDNYIFDTGFGNDRVAGFANGTEKITVTNVTGASAATLNVTLGGSGNVFADFGGPDSIEFIGITNVADIDASDFIF